ncbi:MAG: 3-phosphoserine/phosphohydroxythreonine transaminase [Oligoflexales bacterium]
MNFKLTWFFLWMIAFSHYSLAVDKNDFSDLAEIEKVDSDENSNIPVKEIEDQDFISRIGQVLKLRRDNPDNFCAGPGMNYTDVIQRVVLQLFSFQGGVGIQELSHRDEGGAVQNLIVETKQRVKKVLNVPDNYEVLFMTGGAHFQFDTIPINLLKSSKQADYVDSGFWSKRAKSHLDKLNYDGRLVDVLSQDPKTGLISLKPEKEWSLSPEASYVHICDNETTDGIQYRYDPKLVDSDKRPLVTDATSSLLSRRMQIENYGIIYASGGKNLGPAGVTLVIIRSDLLEKADGVGYTQEYKNYADYGNLYNTPDIISITFLNETLKTVEKQGLEAIEKRAITRSSKVYSIIDSSQGFYINKVDPKWRSTTSIPFTIRERELELKFVKEAEAAGFRQVKGHHSVGGLRVSLYNPIPDEAVERFSQFLKKFQQNYDSSNKNLS